MAGSAVQRTRETRPGPPGAGLVCATLISAKQDAVQGSWHEAALAAAGFGPDCRALKTRGYEGGSGL